MIVYSKFSMRSPISVAFEAKTLKNRLRTGIQINTIYLLLSMPKTT